MTRARRGRVSFDATSFYRCVSRAFLCDEGKLTGQGFGHPRLGVGECLESLVHVFTIDICA